MPGTRVSVDEQRHLARFGTRHRERDLVVTGIHERDPGGAGGVCDAGGQNAILVEGDIGFDRHGLRRVVVDVGVLGQSVRGAGRSSRAWRAVRSWESVLPSAPAGPPAPVAPSEPSGLASPSRRRGRGAGDTLDALRPIRAGRSLKPCRPWRRRRRSTAGPLGPAAPVSHCSGCAGPAGGTCVSGHSSQTPRAS